MNDQIIKLEDNKQENIAFVIDLDEELFKSEMTSGLEYKFNHFRISRFESIFEQLINFCKLKDFIATKPVRYALYIYKDNLQRLTDYISFEEFIIKLDEYKGTLSKLKRSSYSYFDIAEVLQEA
jgi:hypothetical protein